ncbi:MAG: hypothetical protein V1807_01685 [Patescibacteria group bacterium]
MVDFTSGVLKKYCTCCGGILVPDDKFCVACGAPVAQSQPPVQHPLPLQAQVQSDLTEVPQEICHWSWPAFWWGWIWAWGIGYYFWPLAVLVLVVLSGILWMLFWIWIPAVIGLYIYMCIRGNVHAWRTNRFSSVEQFIAIERKWIRAVWIIIWIDIVLGVVLGILLSTSLNY